MSNIYLFVCCATAFLLNGITSGAESDVNYVETSFRLLIDVTYLNNRCVESGTVEKNNLNSSVKLCRTNNSTGWLLNQPRLSAHNNVDLYVQLGVGNARLGELEATVKLLARDDRCNEPVIKRVSHREFSNSASTAAIKGFVGWNYFLKNFVSDDYATIEIRIRTPTSSRQPVPEAREEESFYEIGSRIHFMLDDVTNLLRKNSPEMTVGGIRWKVIVERRNFYLGVYLEGNDTDFKRNTVYKVDAKFKLLTYDQSTRAVIRDFTHYYGLNSTKEGFEQFLKFSDFIDINEHYIRANKANLLVEFTVEEKKSDVVEYTSSEDFNCSACLKEFCSADIYSANCGHLYCEPCFAETQQNTLVCPECGSSIRDGIHPLHTSD